MNGNKRSSCAPSPASQRAAMFSGRRKPVWPRLPPNNARKRQIHRQSWPGNTISRKSACGFRKWPPRLFSNPKPSISSNTVISSNMKVGLANQQRPRTLDQRALATDDLSFISTARCAILRRVKMSGADVGVLRFPRSRISYLAWARLTTSPTIAVRFPSSTMQCQWQGSLFRHENVMVPPLRIDVDLHTPTLL
jgi:hypothetical protein